MSNEQERIQLKERESSWSKHETLKKYTLEAILGEGAFGIVYKAKSTATGRRVAIKVEEIVDDSPTLSREFVILKELRGLKSVPKIHSFHKVGSQLVLVMDLFGQNLISFMRESQGRIILKRTIEIGNQLLSAVKEIHSKRVIHRDIKPENIVFGLGEDSDKIFLVDFGLAKFYKDEEGVHIPFKTGKELIGTTKYASLFTHEGLEQSRRDDLESAFYTLLSFYNIGLPWRTVPESLTRDARNKFIEKQKRSMTKEIEKYMNKDFDNLYKAIRQLEFTEDPDYTGLKQKMSKSLPKSHPIFKKLYLKKAPSVKDEDCHVSDDDTPNSVDYRVCSYTSKQPHILQKAPGLEKMEAKLTSNLKGQNDTTGLFASPNLVARCHFVPLHTYQRDASSDKFSLDEESMSSFFDTSEWVGDEKRGANLVLKSEV